MLSLEEHPESNHPAPVTTSDEDARPHEIYRLAVIVEGLLDSANDQDALQTIRGELLELIHDLAPMEVR